MPPATSRPNAVFVQITLMSFKKKKTKNFYEERDKLMYDFI